MRVGVTGSSGFIGKALCDELINRKYDTSAAVRTSRKFLKNNCKNFEIGDISSKNKNFKFFLKNDCIIHCAARVHVNHEAEKDSLALHRKINVEATKNLAQQAVEFGIKRFIFLSTIKVNGERTTGASTFKHNDISNPQDAYSISKLEAEKALLEISQQSGLEVVIIRAPLVYGEGVKGNFLKLLGLVHKEIPLPFANVKNLRSFIGVDNLIDLIICCVDHPKAAGKTFLAADGEDISTPELIRKLSKLMRKSPILLPIPVSIIRLISSWTGKFLYVGKLLDSLRIDNSYTHEILGWKPPFSFCQQLEKTVHWYLRN